VLVALVTTAVFIVVAAAVVEVVTWVVTIADGSVVGWSAINVTVFGPVVVTLTVSW
jgi:hypothetical protein